MNKRFGDEGIWNHPDLGEKKTVAEHITKYATDKSKSTCLLLEPFVEREIFLRY